MRGADPEVVRRAIDDGDPFPGTTGFAGELDGWLVRDLLGRYPLFSDRERPSRWSVDPTELDAADRVPAGHLRPLPSDDGATTGGGPRDSDERVWTLPDPDTFPDEYSAIEAIRDAVTTSVDRVAPDGSTGADGHGGSGDGAGDAEERRGSSDGPAVAGGSSGPVDGPPAIAFSGGLDSSILAARLDGPLYVGGFEGSHDVEAARTGADSLGRAADLRVVEFSHDDLERAVPEIVRATGRTNPMDVQIALPLYLVAERVAEDGHDRLAVGQGADELFGGYAKVADAADHPRVDAETVRGATRELIAGLPAQLERDVLVLRAAGVEPVRPLLHDRVVSAALRLPGSLLVADGERKVALRRAADFLPDPVRTRDKKAAQYGSLAAREFDRLARRAGFKRRMDDHLERYVESLLE